MSYTNFLSDTHPTQGKKKFYDTACRILATDSDC